MARNDKAIELVNDIISCCRDSQQVYLEAADHINDTRLRTYFNERSLERAKYAGELEEQLRDFGDHDLKSEGTTGGAIRRAWMDVKASLGGGDHSILSSLEACEDQVKQAYMEAMKEPLPGKLSSAVRSQAQSVFSAHDYVRSIRDRKAAA